MLRDSLTTPTTPMSACASPKSASTRTNRKYGVLLETPAKLSPRADNNNASTPYTYSY